MKSVLFICNTNPSSDPRPNRMIRCLKDDFKVAVAAEHAPDIEGVEFIPIRLHTKLNLREKLLSVVNSLSGNFESLLWTREKVSVRDCLTRRDFDLVIISDLNLLPLGFAVKNRAKILFDAHEYFTRDYEYELKGRLFFQGLNNYICSRYLRICDSVITVCDGLARQYYEDYGVRPEVIMNTPFFCHYLPTQVNIDNVRMIHHGIVDAARLTHGMVDMMDYVDKRFSLDLMLMPTRDRYFNSILLRAKKRKNIRIIPPVAYGDVVSFINGYDIGVFLTPPTTFSLTHCLPNKLFEFIQARLAVAIGPSIEMKKIVEKYDCGVISRDFKPRTLAAELNKLNIDNIRYYKGQSNLASRELCYENNIPKIKAIVHDLIGI